MNKLIVVDDTRDTDRVGRQLARNLQGGEVINLIGDLGAGKTTLARAIISELTGLDDVASPSFTITRTYEAGNFTIHHYDFYRVAEVGIIGQELSEIIGRKDSVIIMEWAEIVQDAIDFTNSVDLKITPTADDSRQIRLESPRIFEYITRGIL